MGVALEAFGLLIARDDARIDLARACLMIAQDAYPGLDVERYLGAIERMAIRLRAAMPPNVSAEERVVALNKFLYEDKGSGATPTTTTIRATRFSRTCSTGAPGFRSRCRCCIWRSRGGCTCSRRA